MEAKIRQLTDMVLSLYSSRLAAHLRACVQGATVAQAKAALAQYKDVMQAAERFFEGAFDHVKDEDGDVHMADIDAPMPEKRTIRMVVRPL